jgi:hypothetical protein
VCVCVCVCVWVGVRACVRACVCVLPGGGGLGGQWKWRPERVKHISMLGVRSAQRKCRGKMAGLGCTYLDSNRLGYPGGGVLLVLDGWCVGWVC